jgi:hypothetical protein
MTKLRWNFIFVMVRYLLRGLPIELRASVTVPWTMFGFRLLGSGHRTTVVKCSNLFLDSVLKMVESLR